MQKKENNFPHNLIHISLRQRLILADCLSNPKLSSWQPSEAFWEVIKRAAVTGNCSGSEWTEGVKVYKPLLWSSQGA